jgi:hypothetical protein
VRTAVVALALGAVGVPSAFAVAGAVPTGVAATATVKLDVALRGPEPRACSGALLSRWWVVTAKSCFQTVPGAAVAAGAPARATTATVGRVDLTGTAGRVVAVDRLQPHPDRDLVLARLSSPVDGVAPVRLAATPPVVGQELTVTGFGRTATSLVPDTSHAATYTVTAVGGSTIDIQASGAGATICKGDAGGPALRATAGGVELVAIHHTAYQGGCVGSAGTLQGATETRVDDLRAWISRYAPSTSSGTETVGVREATVWHLNDQNDGSAPERKFGYGNLGDTVVVGDWNGDGIDTIGVWRSGVWYLNDQNDGSAPEHVFPYGDPHHVPVVGDWNGDGVDTVGVRDGSVWHLNDQNDSSAPERKFVYGEAAHRPVVGDWNGDGVDTVGVRDGSVWHLNDQNDGSAPEDKFVYGDAYHVPVVGDWNGDGVDTVGVRDGSVWHLNDQNDGSAPERKFVYGEAAHVPVVGDWDGA